MGMPCWKWSVDLARASLGRESHVAQQLTRTSRWHCESGLPWSPSHPSLVTESLRSDEAVDNECIAYSSQSLLQLSREDRVTRRKERRAKMNERVLPISQHPELSLCLSSTISLTPHLPHPHT